MPGRFIRFFFLTALCLAVGRVFVVAAPEPSPWLRVGWSTDHGLPNNTIVGIVQTGEGFLWLGTPNGLVRFDGTRFEEIGSTNLVALPNRGILTMTASRAGGLHLGLDRGAVVSLGRDGKEVFYPDDKLSLHLIDTLVEGARGELWVGYRNGSVGRLEAGELKLLGSESGWPEGAGRCALACDMEGRLWFLKNGILGQWREGRFEELKRLPAGVGRLTGARGGGLWICLGSQLLRYAETGELQDCGSFEPAQSRAEPTAVLETRDGAIWIGTTFSGLIRYDGAGFEAVPTAHQEILSLAEDAEGNIWAGTGGGGLVQIRLRAVTVLTTADGLRFDGVQSLCQDSGGTIWAALRGGDLARLNEGKWEIWPVGGDWAGDALCVCADPAGGIWVGTRTHRLLRWRDGGFKTWGEAELIRGQTVRTLVATAEGDLFLAEDSPGAIQRVSKGTVQDYPLPPEVRAVRASVQDAAGTVWFGTSSGMLLKVDGDQLVDETARTTREPQSIRGLAATPDGSLWIAYAGWGVGRYKEGKFARISAQEGLFDDYVSQILPDGKGWLWFGANRGLFKVRQEELDAVAEGRANRVRSVRYGPGEYGQSDWGPSLQANFGNSPIALRTRGGRLWFAMRTGLVSVDPGKARESTQPPAILVTSVKVGERVMAAYGGIVPVRPAAGGAVSDLAAPDLELRIPPDHRRLEIGFTALSFAGAENSAFRYRLRGMEEGWAETSQRSAVYPRLSAGRYRFQVVGCNHEGVWNELGASVKLVVVPFFWQTWWFRGLLVLVFTGGVIGSVRYLSFRRLRARLRQLEAQASLHRERARIAKDIHDDLGASLTQISLIAELARQDAGAPGMVAERLAKMSNTARRAVKSLDEIVWAVNPRNDTLAHFIDYTGQYALDFLRVAGLRCRLDLPEHPPERELSTDVRHNLFLVVKEAITNCVKHAAATELRLQIEAGEQELSITVADNGRGFEGETESATADGLRNMRQRVADIGGECRIDSRAGAGTSVSVRLPWAQARANN